MKPDWLDQFDWEMRCAESRLAPLQMDFYRLVVGNPAGLVSAMSSPQAVYRLPDGVQEEPGEVERRETARPDEHLDLGEDPERG